MRLTELLIVCALCFVLMGGISTGIKRSVVLAERAREAERKAMCLMFVSESFRDTCSGGGFENLKNWQLSCKAMYNLDYIGYGTDDSSFLYYATWTGPYGTGEVYERRKDK